MKEDILDVLLYLFEHYIESDIDINANPDTIREELIEAGFQQQEVLKAFDWLESLTREQNIQVARPTTFRVFSEQETQKLDIASRGYILYLEHAGILTPTNRELVIDRAMAIDTEEFGLDQLKWIVLMVLFSLPDEQAAYARMENLLFDTLPNQLH